MTEVLYGQLVIGPAGSGKTTFCRVVSQYLNNQNREVILVNLDPDNNVSENKFQIDIGELIKLTDVMKNEKLGPNGSFLFCIEFLYTNINWLYRRIEEEFNDTKRRIQEMKAENRKPYIIFDCPGQIELYTNYSTFKNLIHNLLNGKKQLTQQSSSEQQISNFKFDLRLVTVNIVDSHYATDASKFITVILNSLISMLHIETPFVNILSKVDIMEQYGQTDFGLDYYCELPDLTRLADRCSDDPFLAKYKKLTHAIASIIENYSLVTYIPVNINDNETVTKAMALIDRANGFTLEGLSSAY